MTPMNNPQAASADEMLAYNLWQLEEERVGRERRMALRGRRFFRPLPKGWWKRPFVWALVFTGVFMARDAFASLLVNLLVN
ncbi:MAG: hypothetical protein HOL37_06970 [Rhodospirillaceae bacterium]|jgi:hypothetical protein|nr:hypothetical protein [Rhodospirillaceae bacterium]MBT4218549.1 hypothetical protein [Rhodospirillaceae bacterium]MBT4464782.1 hypothetical protein [Rhodospirillaceae bacterium]MBT5309058.1 hypothetical protein [Rhodospirillaceae bacterium]MBT7356180.1 hypothetical protein [Rhodospirillaceae bacterium]